MKNDLYLKKGWLDYFLDLTNVYFFDNLGLEKYNKVSGFSLLTSPFLDRGVWQQWEN